MSFFDIGRKEGDDHETGVFRLPSGCP